MIWPLALEDCPGGVLGKAGADSVQARQAWAGLCHRDTLRKAGGRNPAELPEAGWPSALQALCPLHVVVCPFSRTGPEVRTCPCWEQRDAELLSLDPGGGTQGHVGWGRQDRRGQRKGGPPSTSAAGVEPGKSVAFGIRQACAGVQALPVTSCVASDKFLSLSDSSHSYCLLNPDLVAGSILSTS